MIPETVLAGLLLVSVTLGVLLVLVAMAALGRKLADAELLIERDIQGVPRIQALINIRSQIGNAMLGLVFVVINVLLIADAPVIIRTQVNRVLWTILLAMVLSHSVLDWLAERRQVRLLIRDQTSTISSYRAMAAEAVTNLEAAVSQIQGRDSVAPLPPLAAVLPEHQSPSSPEQRETADVATLRARLVAANLAIGIPPEPTPETPPEREA